MKTILIPCLTFCAATTALAQFTHISNLNQPTGGSFSIITSGQMVAVSFTTGGDPMFLTGVAISLAGSQTDISGNGPGPIGLSFNADAGGSPGNQLTTLNGNLLPTNAGIYSYLPGAQIALAPNTAYWIVVSSISSVNGAGYRWSETASSALDAGSIWSLGPTEYFNGTWNTAGTHQLFSVSAAPTNPPPLAISAPVVLTFTNTGISYVLQQNDNLSTTNWVAVTNAILSGVLGNQGVFIVSPDTKQRFYRLSLP